LEYFAEESKSDQQNFLSKMAENSIQFVEESYAEQTFLIWSKFKQSNTMEHLLSNNNTLQIEVADLKKNHSNIFHAYKNAPNSRIRRTLLSLIPENFSYSSIQIAFKVTHWQVRNSREHRKEYGIGSYIVNPPFHRDSLEMKRVHIFLTFICQSGYLQDVAYGFRNLKINEDVTIVMPDVIRLACHKTIILDYFEMCKNENLMALSESTCYKILNACPASFSKCLQGLDNTLAEGLDAFDSIEKLLSHLHKYNVSQDLISSLQAILKSSRIYLEHGYTKNIEFHSDCADHCANYALTHPKESATEIACLHPHKKKHFTDNL
jgi:hypothetical protein